MSEQYSSKNIFLDKLKKYCDYQDRCQQEVLNKMKELRIDPEWQDEILLSLIQHQFLNEERYARSVVRGKFNQKQWGRNKIKQFLIIHGIKDNLIKMAMDEINEEQYRKTLNSLIEKKRKDYRFTLQSVNQTKLFNYLIQKGYEPNLIKEELYNITDME